MTLSATATRNDYNGDGSTTTFAFGFIAWAASEVKVYVRSSDGTETLKTLTTHYTLSPVSYPSAGNVVFVTAPASGETVHIIRSQSMAQALDLVNGDSLPSDLIERRFDIIVGLIQNLSERIDRTLQLPITSSFSNLAMPEPSTDAVGDVMCVNADGDGFTLAASALSDTATVTSFMETLLDDTTAGAALTTLGLTAFVKTLMDDSTAGAFLTTLGISAFVQTLLDDAAGVNFLTTLGFLHGSATINFASVADNATSAASTVTVTGAAVGDLCFCTADGDIMTTAGAFLFGKVTSSNTVSAYVHNDSGGAFDAASQTVYAFVIPKSLFGL